MQEHKKKQPKAILIGVQLPHMNTEAHEASMAELRRLVDTLGYQVVNVYSQRLKHIDAATVIGKGKLQEIAEWTPGDGVVPSGVPKHRRSRSKDDSDDSNDSNDSNENDAQELAYDDGEQPIALEYIAPETSDIEEALLLSTDPDEIKEDTENTDESDDEEEKEKHVDLLIFNREITPTQLRNLEQATSAEILDRNGVIIEIFHRHAKTREARLQIEIAQLQYMAPRLRMSRAKGGDRQAGGIGGKGAGETQHELDKRRIRDRIAELHHQLDAIAKEDAQRRERRHDAHSVALIGYTNAGKSSLMRRMTSDSTYIADKLFATLGTTVRVMQPETKPRVLISDTVGFINELPHELVASFRSTLDEARFASLVLHIVDASDPNFRTQIQVSLDVLKDLETIELPRKLVLNKIDKVDQLTYEALRREFPDAITMSAHQPEDIEDLKQKIIAFFEREMVDRTFHIPYKQGKWTGELHKRFRVLQTEHDADGVWLQVRGKSQELEALYDPTTTPFLIDATERAHNPFRAASATNA